MLKSHRQVVQIKSIIDEADRISITAHRNPDGDALGASLALYWYLTRKGKKVALIYPSEYPESFSWMPGIEKALIYDNDPEEAIEAFTSAQVKFCLDFNTIDRIDHLGKALMEQEDRGKVVMIDHHLDPDDFPDVTISESGASSTAELIYHLIDGMDDLDEIDHLIADCLFTGIITDTGSFRHATSARLYRVAGELKAKGADDYRIQDLINNSLKEQQLRLIGHCLYNRMEILNDIRAGIIYLSRDDYQRYNIQRGDTEGIVNYMLMIRDVKVSVFVMEQPNIVKLSFRSKGDISVQEIARKYFKGGGHKNASGGSSFFPLDATLEKLKRVLYSSLSSQVSIHEK
jgi:phosphoesterase RecJ-like protein